MNPYAAHLADNDPRQVIRATPSKITSLVGSCSEAQLNESPAPGKWSVREVLCHLADCELVFAFRIRQTLAENGPVIQPFDQELWARNYGAYTAQAALAAFTAVREWNVALVLSLPAEAFERAVTHPERGPMTLQTIVETMAGHDINHLRQMEQHASTAVAGSH